MIKNYKKFLNEDIDSLHLPEDDNWSYAEEAEKAASFPLGTGDHLVCIYSDHKEFDYGKLYKIQEISKAKLTIGVYGNSGKRWFFHNDVRHELIGKVFRNESSVIINRIILFPGTLEDYLDKKEAEKYNL